MIRYLLASVLCLLAFAACDRGARHIDTEVLAAELLQVDKDFAALSEQSDPKQAFAAYLAPNAIMLPRTGDPVNGYENAIASFGEKPGFELFWQPQFAEVAASGDLGWTWGTYQVQVDGAQAANGKYVNIWTRQPDGAWKVRLDMGNQETSD